MISLCTWFLLLVLSLFATAGPTLLAARRAGSRRARLGPALLASAALLALSLTLSALHLLLPATPPLQAAAALLLLLCDLAAAYLILRRTFALPFPRSLAPLAGYLAASILLLTLTLLLIRPFVSEPLTIPTSGMSPTLNPGDRLLADKLLRPHRWDLVACRDDHDPHHPLSCQRLVGLPGDHLRFDNDQLYVDDLLTMPPAPLLGHLHASPLSLSPDQARYHDGQTITLAPDEYFLLSTNPTLSPDSRLTGPSKRPALIGVVDLIYWPPTKIRILR